MKTKIDEVYKELKSRLKYNLKFTDFEIWYSFKGVQTRCKRNKGPIQVNCQGLLKLCPRKK